MILRSSLLYIRLLYPTFYAICGIGRTPRPLTLLYILLLCSTLLYYCTHVRTYGNKEVLSSSTLHMNGLSLPCPALPACPALTLLTHLTHPPCASLQKTAGKKGVFTNGTATLLLAILNRETWRMWRCLFLYYVFCTCLSECCWCFWPAQTSPLLCTPVQCLA